jgi:hypothetical protein
MLYAQPGATGEEAVAGNFPTGLSGTIGVTILDNVGGTFLARTTKNADNSNIRELVAGVYSVVLPALPTVAGHWSIVWDDASGRTAVEDLIITASGPVVATPSGSDLCTVADVKQAMEPTLTTSARDGQIQTAITAASAEIPGWCEREFMPQSSGLTRTVPIGLAAGEHSGTIVDLTPYDLRAATALVLHPESGAPVTLTSSDYVLEPLGKPRGSYDQVRLSNYLYIQSDFSLRFGYAQLDVTGNWGIFDTASVSEDLRNACITTVRSWLRQNPAGYAFGGDVATEPGVQPDLPQTFSLPGGVLREISSWQRRRF